MARKPRDYHAEYERRIALGKARYFSKQRARGHAGTRERPVPLGQEHRMRAARAIERGDLTPAEKAFIKRQRERFYRTNSSGGGERWSKGEQYFRNASPAERDYIRMEQRKMAQRYRPHVGQRWSQRTYVDPAFWLNVPSLDLDKAVLYFYH